MIGCDHFFAQYRISSLDLARICKNYKGFTSTPMFMQRKLYHRELLDEHFRNEGREENLQTHIKRYLAVERTIYTVGKNPLWRINKLELYNPLTRNKGRAARPSTIH